jgi:hypothetical protein
MTILSKEFKTFSLDKKLAALLTSWDATTKYLRLLTPDEILKALKHEKSRPDGPRMNILFRLAQRYDNATKSRRLQELIQSGD